MSKSDMEKFEDNEIRRAEIVALAEKLFVACMEGRSFLQIDTVKEKAKHAFKDAEIFQQVKESWKSTGEI